MASAANNDTSQWWRQPFRVGDYRVDPLEGTVTHLPGGEPQHITPVAVEVLLKLVRSAGNVVERDALLDPGRQRHPGGDEALTQAIHQLRDAFQDDARHPRYIKTVHRRGYVLVAGVDLGTPPVTEAQGKSPQDQPGGQPDGKRHPVVRVAFLYAVGAWLTLQLADLVFDALEVPAWTMRLLIAAIIVCFPLVLALAWGWSGKVSTPAHETDSGGGISNQREWMLIGAAGIVAALLLYLANTRTELTEPRADEANAIAVLPFASYGKDPEVESLGFSLVDELIARLSRLPELQVLSRTATPANADLGSLASRYLVRFVVEGRIEREGERMRATVKLVETATGRVSWSKNYDHVLGSFFEIIDAIARQLAKELAIELSPRSRETLAPPTGNEQAYSYYLQGREALQRPKDSEVLARAADLFRRAIELDPNFAAAHAGLCDTYLAQFINTRDDVWVTRAKEACNRSLKLDPGAAEVHMALGNLYRRTGELEQAEQALKNALEINPSFFEVHVHLGELYAQAQRYDEAERAFRQAMTLQRGNWIGYSAYGLYLLHYKGAYEQAQKYFQEVLTLTPDSVSAYNNLGAAFFLQGNFTDAASAYAESLDRTPNRTAFSNRGLMLFYMGDFGGAVEMFERATELARDDHRVLGNLAMARSFVEGEQARAHREYHEAIVLASRWLESNPADFEAQADLATYYAAVGEREQALERLEAAVQATPQDPAMHFFATLTYETLGNRTEALAALEMALELGYSRRLVESDPRLGQLVASPAYNSLVAKVEQS